MRILVVDASAVVEYLLGSDLGRAASTAIEDRSADLHSPALCDVEVLSALRGLVGSRNLTLARALEALEDYADLPLTRHGHLPLLERMLELRDNFSAYDASYVALAEALNATLLTCDAPLARASKKHVSRVDLLLFGETD